MIWLALLASTGLAISITIYEHYKAAALKRAWLQEQE